MMDPLVHDVIKMNYSYYGYLPNTPYHLISNEEMCEAFMKEEGQECYFFDNYPCLVDKLRPVYDELIASIRSEISKFVETKGVGYMMPDWVYQYMLGSVVTVSSIQQERHDLLTLFLLDNIDDEFTPEVQVDCYLTSKLWVKKLQGENIEPVTIFGAPHVFKSLRLQAAAIFE